MDFIERWLHISPDGGSGLLEAIYLVVAIAVVTGFMLMRRWAARARRNEDRF